MTHDVIVFDFIIYYYLSGNGRTVMVSRQRRICLSLSLFSSFSSLNTSYTTFILKSSHPLVVFRLLTLTVLALSRHALLLNVGFGVGVCLKVLVHFQAPVHVFAVICGQRVCTDVLDSGDVLRVLHEVQLVPCSGVDQWAQYL